MCNKALSGMVHLIGIRNDTSKVVQKIFAGTRIQAKIWALMGSAEEGSCGTDPPSDWRVFVWARHPKIEQHRWRAGFPSHIPAKTNQFQNQWGTRPNIWNTKNKLYNPIFHYALRESWNADLRKLFRKWNVGWKKLWAHGNRWPQKNITFGPKILTSAPQKGNFEAGTTLSKKVEGREV